MKRLWIVVAVMAVLLIAATQASARGRFSIHGDYNAPVSTNSIGSNLEFGAQYRFWGVFQFDGSIYTTINYGADNLFNIRSISPIGLFSAGVGMRIPLGGFALEFGWSQFFTGIGDNDGIYHFSDSFNIGLSFDLSHRLGLRVYSRTLYHFTPEALQRTSYGVSSPEDRVHTLGAGVVVHLF